MPDSALAASICTRRRSTISRHRWTKSIGSTSRGICACLADRIEIICDARRGIFDDVGDVELHRAHASDDEAHADLVFAGVERAAADGDRDCLPHREGEGLLAGDGSEGKRAVRALEGERRLFGRDWVAIEGEWEHLFGIAR